MLTWGLLRTNFSFDTSRFLVWFLAEPSPRIELGTPSLPRRCTATVLRGRIFQADVVTSNSVRLQSSHRGCGAARPGKDGTCNRADDGTRTHDNQLGRLELYQLSYAREQTKHRSCVRGGRWIRTTVGIAGRFTVCYLWPLGHSSGTCLYR